MVFTVSAEQNLFGYAPAQEAGAINGPVVKWLRHHPFTVVSRVRLSVGSPIHIKPGFVQRSTLHEQGSNM